jgi:hypothetical protein
MLALIAMTALVLVWITMQRAAARRAPERIAIRVRADHPAPMRRRRPRG